MRMMIEKEYLKSVVRILANVIHAKKPDHKNLNPHGPDHSGKISSWALRLVWRSPGSDSQSPICLS